MHGNGRHPMLSRKRRRRGWLQDLLDPETSEFAPETDLNHRRSVKYAVPKVAKHKYSNPRTLLIHERLTWLTSQIITGKSIQKIQTQFMLKYSMSKAAAKKYVRRVFQDFDKQFTKDRNILMAEHCMILRDFARRSADARDFIAAEKLLRQYGETIGVVTPAAVLKYQYMNQDNRQQLVVQTPNKDAGGISPQEIELTLQKMEQLSSNDLLKMLPPPPSAETAAAARAAEAEFIPGEDAQGTAPDAAELIPPRKTGVPRGKKARAVRVTASHQHQRQTA